MEDTYERRLRRLAEGVPKRPCVVALVPTIAPDEAAALANDLARCVGAGRGAHTLLVSFESAQARLDHEIGLEEGRGLTDVLAGRAAMHEVAAPGRARPFIYVPAGGSAAAGSALLRSKGWASLAGAAVRGGGTILAFVPSRDFEAAGSGADGGVEWPRWDAVAWLGPEPEEDSGLRRTAAESAALNLGSLDLPGAPSSGAPAAVPGRAAADAPPGTDPPSAEEPGAASAAAAAAESRPDHSPGDRRRVVPRPVVLPAADVRIRRTAARRAERLGLFLFFALLGLMAGAFVYFGLVSTPQGDEPPVRMASPGDSDALRP